MVIMIPSNPFMAVLVMICLFVILRFLLRGTSLLFMFKNLYRWIEDKWTVYQFYKVPEFNEILEENQLYAKVSTYVSSLASIEDSDFANLFSGRKSNEISVELDLNQSVYDSFLGARISWMKKQNCNSSSSRSFVLKMKKTDKQRRILGSYLQHIHSVSDEIQLRRKEIKFFTTATSSSWKSVPFTHPSTLETIAMESDLKSKVKSDLESFLKSKQYYLRLGRVWRRSYLLYGPSGTGKSSFVAAMAKILLYDLYEIHLSKFTSDSQLKSLLLQTTPRSLIVLEDLDKFLASSSMDDLSGTLNFMDGIFSSCCGEERVMVFTMSSKDEIEPSILRPGRIDAQIYFPLCDFSAFKTLANSYLGLKDHKLFHQVEEIFQSGARLSPAEIGEIMIVNRSSPSRALKSVITALQTNVVDGRGTTGKIGRKLSIDSKDHRSGDESGEPSGVICKESGTINTVTEFKKLYSLLTLKSYKKPADTATQLI